MSEMTGDTESGVLFYTHFLNLDWVSERNTTHVHKLVVIIMCLRQKCFTFQVPQPAWQEGELLSEMINVDRWVANNLVRLFDNENTIPFIARYRRELTSDMSPKALRLARDALDTVK